MSVLVLSPAELDVAARLLADGAVVGVPTDTVYGLAAALDDDHAILSLFSAKQRPDDAPIAILCATPKEAASLATAWIDAAERLTRRFWPGPLTVVVESSPQLVSRLRAGRGIGMRVPADATCLELLARTGPLAVTSANLHGEPPSTTAAQVAAAFEGSAVRAVVDDGRRDGDVSTVADLTGGSVAVLREGAIALDDLLSAVSEG